MKKWQRQEWRELRCSLARIRRETGMKKSVIHHLMLRHGIRVYDQMKAELRLDNASPIIQNKNAKG